MVAPNVARLVLALLALGCALPCTTYAQTHSRPATIDFGPLGPVQRQVFADNRVRATITYRIAHDRQNDGGPGGATPSIAVGTLTVITGGTRRAYDLARVLPIRDNHVLLASGPKESCYAAEGLSRSGNYLVIEAIPAQKGCSRMAVFVEFRTGEVAKEVIFNPAWVHRFDPRPERSAGKYLTVVRTEHVTAIGARFDTADVEIPDTWKFIVVHTIAHDKTPHTFLIDVDYELNVDGRAIVVRPGSRVFVGSFDAGEEQNLYEAFGGEQSFRPSPADELRYEALQTPTPPKAERYERSLLWYTEADHAADRGQFDDAVNALVKMLSYHTNDSLSQTATQTLKKCRALQSQVHAGKVSSSAASTAFSRDDCVLRGKASTEHKIP